MRLLNLMSLVLCLGFVSFNAQAQWVPSPRITQSDKIGVQPLRCPTIGQDHSQMISSLQSLQDKIKKDANCEALANELKQMGELGNQRRTEFLNFVKKVQAGEALSDLESKKMVTYVEEMTVKAAGLAALLSNSAQCFGEQDSTTSMFAISSFVNEATTLLSTVAGPWGPALSIGGKLVSGLIQGVSRFINAMPGYDFKDKKDWQAYVETLCMFHEQQDEIEALIHPDKAISDLNVLNLKADEAIRVILNNNPEGDKVVSSFLSQNEAELEIATNSTNAVNQSQDGVKVVRLLTAQQWIGQRILDIEKDANDPLINVSGQNLISRMRNEIEDFLIHRQGYKFIDFQNNDTKKLLGNFANVMFYTGNPLFARIRYIAPNLIPVEHPSFFIPTDADLLTSLLKLDPIQFLNMATPEGDAIYNDLLYFKREISRQWDAITLSYGVKTAFCDFFQKTGYQDNSIRSSCSSRTAKWAEQSIQNYINMGVNLNLPSSLKPNREFFGLDWSQALGVWLNQQ